MEGILTVLKPPAMSSSNVVVDIKKICGTKHVGHLGTLDPEAAGVLPVCVGRAVRLFDYLVDKEKEYITELVFGMETDTQDAQGAILARSDAAVSQGDLEQVLPLFQGDFEQTAPMYSALKYQGKKLYDLARSGAVVPEKKRMVHISELKLIEQTAPNRFLIRVACSRGTYIRTLCHDIGRQAGVPAYMGFLLRVRSGPCTLANSYTIRELAGFAENDSESLPFMTCETALMDYPALRLGESRKLPSINGLDTRVPDMQDGTFRLYAEDSFLGIGVVKSESVHLTVNLFREER